MSIRVILFDLDETLVDTVKSSLTATRRALDYLSPRIPEIDSGTVADQLVKEYMKIWEAADKTRPHPFDSAEELRIHFCRQAFEKVDIRDHSVADEAGKLVSQWSRENHALFPEAEEVLRTLGRSYRLGVVSNGFSEIQREKIEATGLDRFIEEFWISSDLGVEKPDPRVFDRAIEHFGVPPNEMAYVGDNPHKDVPAAQGAGLMAIWYDHGTRTPSQDHTPDHTITNLRELLAIFSEKR